MVCRGVHFGLTPEEGTRLLDETHNNEELLAAVNAIEERWDKKWLQETDKAWDAIHRCLTDGNLHYGESPLHLCILGEDNLYEGKGYIVNALLPEEVQLAAEAIRGVNRAWMLRKYWQINPKDYGSPLSEEDFGYTWAWFKPLKRFFQKAARHGRYVVFTVDL
jgi:hypothetical protein